MNEGQIHPALIVFVAVLVVSAFFVGRSSSENGVEASSLSSQCVTDIYTAWDSKAQSYRSFVDTWANHPPASCKDGAAIVGLSALLQYAYGWGERENRR